MKKIETLHLSASCSCKWYWTLFFKRRRSNFTKM